MDKKKKTISDKILDSILVNQIDMDKYSISLSNKVQRLLNKAQDEIIATLAKNDPTAPTMTEWKQKRLEKISKDIKNILGETFGKIKDTTNDGLIRSGKLQSQLSVNGVNSAVGVDIFDVSITSQGVKAIVENTLIDGKIISDWWDKQKEIASDQIISEMAAGTQALQIGIVQGESIGDLVTRIRGSKLKSGIMDISKRNARALVRTSVMQVANVVKQETYKQNSDVLNGYQWISTLDTRTTPICRALDSKQFDMQLNPIGHSIRFPGCPAHWNCFTSPLVPIYTSKGWKPISKIKVGDLVLTHLGRFKKVTKLLFNNPIYFPEMVKIKLKGDKGKISLTSDHPIFVNGKWEKAQNIKIGDKILFLSHNCANKKCNNMIPYHQKFCSTSCLSSTRCCTEETKRKISEEQKGVPKSKKAILAASKARWNEEKRKRQSAITREQMLKSYELGLRDRFLITKKANEKTREIVKNGKHPFQQDDIHKKAVVNGHLSIKWKNAVFEHMTKNNPMSIPEAKLKMIESNNKRIEQYPERHPNVIMSKRGFMSSLERKMSELLNSLSINYVQQYPIAGKYVDFAILDLNIVIETDGEYWHQDKIADQIRQNKIEQEGWQVFRFSEKQIKKDFNSVREEVIRIVANHSHLYQFASFEVESICKYTQQKKSKLYNFSVEEDESYIAKGFVVHNCRSTLLPIIKSYAELSGSNSPLSNDKIRQLGEKVPIGERATMGDPVSGNVNYDDWLKMQTVQKQQEILGIKRYKLWSENKLDMADLIDNSGNTLTIKQLEDKYK